MWEVKKNSVLLSMDIESCHLAMAMRMKLLSLNTNLFFDQPHQVTKFA